MNRSRERALTDMGTLKLGDLLEEFDERLGSQPEPEILTLTEKMGFVSQRERFNKRLAIEDTSNYKVIGLNDIAFNPYLLWANAIAQNTGWKKAIISPLYPTFRVRNGYHTRFVNYLLCSGYLRSRYGAISYGSVPRKRRATVSDFLNLPIPRQPSLAEQERIVNLLDEADELRKLRAQADRRTTDLILAFFDEMFGKRAIKKFHWPKKPLGDLTTRITKGESPGWQGFQYTNEGPLFITSENVLWGTLDMTEPKRIPLAFHQKLTRSAIQPDDVLLNLVGASIGRCCLVPKGLGAANINQAVAVISCGKQLLPVFLTHMLLSSDAQTYFHGGKVEAARANISLGDIRHFQTAVPPIELQHEFVAHVAEIRGLESYQTTSRRRSDDLFQSLLHRAFQGEL